MSLVGNTVAAALLSAAAVVAPARAAAPVAPLPLPELQQIAADWQAMMALQGHLQTDLQALIRHVQEQDAEIAKLRAAAPKKEKASPPPPVPPKVK